MSIEVRTVSAGSGSTVARARRAARELLALVHLDAGDQITTYLRDLVARANSDDPVASMALYQVTLTAELARPRARGELAGRNGHRTPDRARRRVLRQRLATWAAILAELPAWHTCQAAEDAAEHRQSSQVTDIELVVAQSLLIAAIRTLLDALAATTAWQHLTRARTARRHSTGATAPRVQPRAPRAPSLPVWAGLCW